MNKRNDELQSQLAELLKHKTYLESVKKSYETVFKTKNENLKSASLEHLQKQLKVLASASQTCLDHIQLHHRSLSKQSVAEAMKVIGGIIVEVDEYLPENIISKATYINYTTLFNNLLKTHELITNKENIVIHSAEDKLLLKNLRGQIDYLDKLNNNSNNFSTNNIGKTKERAQNILLILNQLVDKVDNSENSKLLKTHLNQAMQRLTELNIKIELNEPEDLLKPKERQNSTDYSDDLVFKKAKEQTKILLNKLKRLNSSVIYRYYFNRTDKAATALEKSILEMKNELLDQIIPNLYSQLNAYLEKRITKINSYNHRELVSVNSQTASFLLETIKSTQEVLKSLSRFGHEEIDNQFMENVGNLHSKLTELRNTLPRKNTEGSKGAPEWTKDAPATKGSNHQQDAIDSPRGMEKE